MSIDTNTMKHLIHIEPEKAKREILAVLKAAKMHQGDACQIIGCSPAAFIRWRKALGLDEAIEKMTEKAIKEKWHHGRQGGRKEGNTVEAGAKAPIGGRIHEIRILMRSDPKRAKAQILDALKKNQMNKSKTAEQFEVASATFSKWIADLDLDGAIGKLTKKAKAA